MEASPGMYGMKIGSVLPNFSLRGVDERIYSPGSFKNAKVLVIAFTCNHCPYVQAHESRLLSFSSTFMGKEVSLVCINSNDEKNYPDDSFEKMQERAERLKFNFPYLHDKTQDVANMFSALCTPEFFVFDTKRKLAYHGRFDDNWQDSERVQRRYLIESVQSLLDGKRPELPETPCMGCSIKWAEN